MFRCRCQKRSLRRKIVTLMLFSYFIMIFVFLINLDIIQSDSKSKESSDLVDREPSIKDDFLEQATDLLHMMHDSSNSTAAVDRETPFLITGAHDKPLTTPTLLKNQRLDSEQKVADFFVMGYEAYAYSAFIDDRKTPSFIRIMALMSKTASGQPVYCLFNETIHGAPHQLAIRYELCENHEQLYGGYIYSCLLPQTVHFQKLRYVVISFPASETKVRVPLLPVRPPEYKIAYLDLCANSTNTRNITPPGNVDSNKFDRSSTISANKNDQTPPKMPFTFAICVSPLFGNISLYRLVEFIELSRLLGAHYFMFYNHSVSAEISNVLQYYISRNMASVQPWRLPPQVDNSVWYFGQLLAHNDCLYRTMPGFDLVAFNDIDEFIVPHQVARTWNQAFSSLLTDDRCGFAFPSAFYDPAPRDWHSSHLLTPVLTVRSRAYSMIRTKVMLCPWRVFEVGIHHISKQNREEWLPVKVGPGLAFLHHYRSCLGDYGMSCFSQETDTTIADRYLKDLTTNFQEALTNISYFRQGKRL